MLIFSNMIRVRSPLRIPLGGGGTDLPSFYKEDEGLLISASINKYIEISLKKSSNNLFVLKYDQTEETKIVNLIKHDLTREALKFLNIKDHLEITSKSEIPYGTGMGSSGSFLVALLKALHTFKNHTPPPS